MDTVTTAARTRGSVALDALPWERLRTVRLRSGDQPDFVLQARGERAEVPLRLAPDGFLERLQQLEGFDNSVMVAGLARPGVEAEFVCWRSR